MNDEEYYYDDGSPKISDDLIEAFREDLSKREKEGTLLELLNEFGERMDSDFQKFIQFYANKYDENEESGSRFKASEVFRFASYVTHEMIRRYNESMQFEEDA